MNFNQFLNEAYGKPAGLTKEETLEVAQKFADAMSKIDKSKVTVNKRTLEEDSFDLDIDGEEFDGGSYNIYQNGNVMNMAVPSNPIYGKKNDSVDTIAKNMKKAFTNESFLDAYDKNSEELDEAKGFKNTEDFEAFLEEIDGMPESAIKKIMGKDYIDTPGGYADEAEDYDNDIIEYMISNMGRSEFEKLQDYWESNVAESVVNERNITIKRQYTGNHPAVTVGKTAKIRNKVLEAIKDGKISQVEFDNLLKEMTSDSKRWLKRNARHFNVSEDGISLSKSGKAILKNVMVAEATEKAPKIWVPGGFDKAISKYPNSKITRKIVLDAAEKWDVDPEDAITYVEYGWAVDLDENKNTKDMKTKFIYESFSEFVENKLNEGTLNEAFASAKLASLLMGAYAMPKDLPQAFYNMAKLALDKIQDIDILEMTPDQAKKEKRAKAVYFYFTTNEKENPYAGKNSWNAKSIPANTLLAITDGSNEWMNTEWSKHSRQATGRTLVKTKRDDSAGINKSSANDQYGTGISSLKQVVDLADRAYCLDLTVLDARYSTASLKADREAARKGATAIMDPRAFKDENKARYNAILAKKAAAMPIDQVVLDAIDALSNQIKDALTKGEKGKYGDMLIGLDPRGKEVKIGDASNLMRNILDEYNRYVQAVASDEKEKAAGYDTNYYERELTQYAKNISDYTKKIETKSYGW